MPHSTGRDLGPRTNDLLMVTLSLGEVLSETQCLHNCCIQEQLSPSRRRDERDHRKPSRRGLGVFVGDLKQCPLIIPHKFEGQESGQLNHNVLSKFMGISVDREACRLNV